LARGNDVTSLETEMAWASEIERRAGDHIGRLDLVIGDVDDVENGPIHSAEGEFDVIVVDHSGDRVAAVKAGSQRLSANGILILDNSDRPEYQSALEFLLSSGLHQLDFHGLGPINAFAATTSLFFRTGQIPIWGRRVQHVTVPN
jgi:hypothetical protein